ncbi:MAG: MoxR family ATPase [Myxococcales bacterium]|nr:MoxR family ATPase [Myxococcales bacterium]
MATTHKEISGNLLTQISQIHETVQNEVAKAYIGPPALVQSLMTALVARGHVLIEGVPGVAKTTLVKAFAATLGCQYKRVQFTPDLLPSDITGTTILDMRTNTFELREGPAFTNILLGDEINRAPAKTQSALLEAMQEGQVTIEGEARTLEKPFMVLATQNPIEHEGTYPLPDAQVDRFLIKVQMHYPSAEDERRMLGTYNETLAPISAVMSPEDVLRLQDLADQVHVAEEIFDYILALSHFSRDHRQVYLGASPRAALALLKACKALALINARDYVLPDDVKELAPMIFGHRIILTPDAELEGVQTRGVVSEALERVAYKQVRRH